MTITIESMCNRWDGRDRPLFKGELISGDGCCCAQGDVLRVSGWSDNRLRNVEQRLADEAVARILGISVAHSVLLRIVNDSKDGCPQDVLRAPQKILGDQADRVLAFWRRIDDLSKKDWAQITSKPRRVDYEPWGEAGTNAKDAARCAVGAGISYVANYATQARLSCDELSIASSIASNAVNEIQGASVMKGLSQPFFFLPMFGINDPAELDE